MSEPSPTRLANAIRFLAIDAIVRAGEGHQGVPLGMAEIATALYTRHLKFDAGDPTWPDRDRVVLSNGHGSMLLYALLHLSGYERIGTEQVSTFRDFGSRCEGHPEFDPSAGIEVTTGPLGQGIANAFGMAVAEAYLNARFGAERGRPPHLRLRRRRLPAGGDRPGDDLAGRAPAIGQADLAVGRQPHHRRRRDRSVDQRRRRRALSRRRLARRRSRRARPRSRVGGDRRRQGRPAAVADRVPHDHRQGHRTTAGPARRPQRQAVPRRRRRRRASSWAGRRRRSRFRPTCWPAGAMRGRRSRAERESWRARVAALPQAERAEFERIVAGELPEGWRDVLLDYKRGAIERAPLASGIFISAEINDCAGRSHARAHGRLRRPRSAHQPQAAPDRLHGARPQRRLRALRRARARDGRDGQRHGGAWRRRAAGSHLPRVLRLRAPGDAHGRADGAAGEVRVQPRFDRHRPQRPDAPAGGDPGVAARDAQHAGAASRRCGRGGRVLGDRVRASQRAFDARVRAPGAAARAAHAHQREPVAARRLRAR